MLLSFCFTVGAFYWSRQLFKRKRLTRVYFSHSREMGQTFRRRLPFPFRSIRAQSKCSRRKLPPSRPPSTLMETNVCQQFLMHSSTSFESFDTFLLVSQAFCLCLRALMCFSSVQEAFAPFPTKQTSIRFTSLTKLYDDISMFLHGWLDPTTIELRINIFLRHSSHAFAFSFSSLLWDERENIFELVT